MATKDEIEAAAEVIEQCMNRSRSLGYYDPRDFARIALEAAEKVRSEKIRKEGEAMDAEGRGDILD